ncbi:unnamed protein product [Urochloa humidicola]
MELPPETIVTVSGRRRDPSHGSFSSCCIQRQATSSRQSLAPAATDPDYDFRRPDPGVLRRTHHAAGEAGHPWHAWRRRHHKQHRVGKNISQPPPHAAFTQLHPTDNPKNGTTLHPFADRCAPLAAAGYPQLLPVAASHRSLPRGEPRLVRAKLGHAHADGHGERGEGSRAASCNMHLPPLNLLYRAGARFSCNMHAPPLAKK